MALMLCGADVALAQTSPAPHAETSARWLEVSADELILGDEGWEASGHVLISPSHSPQAWLLEARRAELSGTTLTLDGCTLTVAERRVEADHMAFDLEEGRITGTGLTNATSSLAEQGAALKLEGESFALQGEVLVVIGARVTPRSGEQPDDVSWSTPKARLHGVGWLSSTSPAPSARLKTAGATLSVGDVPVWRQTELDTRLDGRQLGLLPPTLGWRGGHGALAEVSAYVPAGDRADAALSLTGASGGLLSSALTLRAAQDDQLGRDHVGALSIHGRLDDPGLMIVGRGAFNVALLPTLRFDAALVGDRTTAEALRGPLATRLGTTTRSAMVLGPRADTSALDLSAALWQPLAGAGPIWGGDTRSSSIIEGVYDLRSAFARTLTADLRLAFARAAPLSLADPSTAGGAQAQQAGQALNIKGAASAPWTLGRFARLTLRAELGLSSDLFDLPADEPSAAAETRLAAGQRALGVVEARVDSHLSGWLFEHPHSLRPTLLVIGAPVRRHFGDDAQRSPTAAMEAEVGRLAVFGGLAQRLGLGSGQALTLDLGVLSLRGIRVSADDLPRDVHRAGGRLGLERGPWGLRAVVEVASGAGERGLKGQSQAMVHYGGGRGSSSTWRGRVSLGLAHQAAGAAMTTPAWRAPWTVPALRAGSERSVTGAKMSIQAPLGSRSPVWIGGWALLPLSGEGTTAADGEWSAQLGLGRLVRGLEVRLEVTRRAAPEAFDAMLTANVLALP